MKMVKKVLMGLAVIAMAFSFVGCIPEVDDSEGAIKGSNKKYTVNYKNEGDAIYRAYKATALNHAGGLVKITFNKKDVGTSKMGVIFDLHDNATNKDAKDFYIIGLGAIGKDGSVTGQSKKYGNFYVSKFTNVTNMQADNFGTKEKTNPAIETEIVALSSTNNIDIKADSEGKITLFVYYKAKTDGSFDFAVFDKDFDDANFNIKTSAVTGALYSGNTMAKAGAEYAACAEGKQPQNKIAFYAQVGPNITLDGQWDVVGTYLEAEDAE